MHSPSSSILCFPCFLFPVILLRRWPYPIPKTLPLHNLNKARVPSGSQWPGIDCHQTRLDSWEASSMTCYSLAIIARDLMSDQVIKCWCVGFYLGFTDWSAMIHGETETYRFWLAMVDDELLCFIDRPSWKSKESKTAQQWLSQFPKSPPVINHVSLKSFKCFRNYNGAASEHTTL